jgi:hypothetical protein
MNPSGGGVSAWPSQDGAGHAAVAVREDFPGGAVQTGLLSGGAGGPVSELAVARSGLGDGILGFLQGPLGNGAVVVDQVTAPPAQFVVSAPKSWIKPSQALVSWLPAPSANPPLSYEVVLDGHLLPGRSGGLEARLDARRLGSGRHTLQVLAIDATGQATLTPGVTLLIDAVAPHVKIARARRGHTIAVTVSDAFSGVDSSTVRVSFGDGSSARHRSRYVHRYAHAGVYLVIVSVRSKAGSAGQVRRWVSVR